MNQLALTPYFKVLSGDSSPLTNSDELLNSYNEFTSLVFEICRKNDSDIPAYFTLAYAKLELEHLQSSNFDTADKKK